MTMPARRYWNLHLLHEGPDTRACLVVGDDGHVGALLWEPHKGGSVEGVRFPEGRDAVSCDATSLDAAFCGVRDAFQVDRLDASTRLN
jgi:hypothetical protein